MTRLNLHLLSVVGVFLLLKLKETLLCPWYIIRGIIHMFRDMFRGELKDCALVVCYVLLGLCVCVPLGYVFLGLWAYIFPDVVAAYIYTGLQQYGEYPVCLALAGGVNAIVAVLIGGLLYDPIFPWLCANWRKAEKIVYKRETAKAARQ